MGSPVLGGLTLKELALRVWREANADNVFGTAAELAYYFLLALFPMLLFLTTLVGFLPGVQENILHALAKVAPGQAMDLVIKTLNDVVQNRSGGLLSFGVLGTLWAASSGVAALMGSLNAVYEVKEGRSFWKQRLVALGMTILLSLLVMVGTLLVMFGDRLSAWLTSFLGLGPAFAVVWGIIDYLLGLALLLVGLDVIYYFGPNVKQKWRWITPGAAFAVVGFMAVSVLFSFYLRFAPSYSATYGSLGAVIVLMLWLYLAGMVALIGGEINSEIEKAAGKSVTEKEPAEHHRAA